MEARYLTDLEWRICHAVNIYVFRNGRDGEQPILVHVPPSKKKNMRTLMNVIQDRVKYPVGYAKFLYKMDGTRVRDPCELEMYNNYVVASNFDKHFKCAAYGRKRSPLIVLNRDSKHVRVLKLQNQNYYEWLLKKKAVGEERPPYIYPTYYTNENYRPQDLPVGQMGNYHPPEVQAPGCCYPRYDDGNKTFRVDGNSKYVSNMMTTDVKPDLSNLTQLPKHSSHKQNHQNGKLCRKRIVEQTPSDMINANVLTSDVTSQEVITATSETEDQAKLRKSRASKNKNSQRKSKSHHRVHLAHSDDKRSVNIDSSILSMETVKKHHKKSGKKSKRKKDKQREYGLPSPPSQFRDHAAHLSSKNRNNQDILNFANRSVRDQNGNIVPLPPLQSPKSFYYSPEKLAEINPAGQIQPFQLASMVQQQTPGPGQWAVIHQPQQQIFAIDPQHSPHAAATTAPIYPGQAMGANSGAAFPSHYPGAPYHPNVQNQPVQQIQGTQGIPMMLQNAQGQQQCVMIQNPNSTQGPSPAPAPQLVTVQNPNSQSHIQHVYRLGIVQQPNPQTCIQVDAKAMRQYVDNQRLLESRFNGDGGGQYLNQSQTDGQRQGQYQRGSKAEMSSEQTESELDIPFTPLKTYRLQQTHSAASDSKLSRSSRRTRERLPKVKSRNVAIQMGYPGTSRVTGFLQARRGPTSEISVLHERDKNPFRSTKGGLSSSSNIILEASPRIGREQSYVMRSNNGSARTSRRNFYESYSDHQYINPRSSRGAFVQKTKPSSSRTARGTLSLDPVLEDLVTIPPPTEFREALRFPERHHIQPVHYFKDNHSTPNNNNNSYLYCNDNDRSNAQYTYSNYTH